MKKSRGTALAIIFSMLVLMFGIISVNATEVTTEVNYTFDETNITIAYYNTNGTFRTDFADPATITTKIEAESATNPNKVLKSYGNRRLANLNFRHVNEITGVGKVVADIFMPSLSNGGKMNIFGYDKSFGTYQSGEGILIMDNGAIYAKDYNYSATAFKQLAPTGTLQGEKWYTFERYFDFRINGRNISRFVIKDKTTNTIIYESDWMWCGEVAPYGTTMYQMNSLIIRTDNFTGDPEWMIDNFKYVYFKDLSTASMKRDGSDDPNLNNYLKYDLKPYGSIGVVYIDGSKSRETYPIVGDILDSEYHVMEESICFPELPTDRDVDIFAYIWGNGVHHSGYAGNGDSGYVKFRGSDLYFRKYVVSTDSSAWVEEKIEGVVIEPNKWYDIKIEYEGLIVKQNDTNFPETAKANIYVSCDKQIIAQKTNVNVKPRYRDNYSRGSIAFVKATEAKSNGTVYVDNIKLTAHRDGFNGTDENKTVFMETTFEDYDIGTVLGTANENYPTVYMTEMNELFSGRFLSSNINYSENLNAVVAEDCTLPEADVPVRPDNIKVEFTFPMNEATFTKQNVTINSLDSSFTGYNIIPAEDGKSFVIQFTESLQPYTPYEMRVSNKVVNADGIPAGSPLEDMTYTFITGAAPANEFTINSLKLVNNDGVEYTKTTLANGDVIKATAEFNVVGETGQPYTLILAVYDGLKLKDVKLYTATITKEGVTTVSTESVTAGKDGLYAKAFLWKGLNSMESLRGAIKMGE